MKRIMSTRVLFLALLLSSVTSMLRAEETRLVKNAIHKATTTSADVALHPGSVLDGQLTDKMGQVLPNTPVSLVSVQANRVNIVATSATGKDGRFVFRQVRAGSYEIRTNSGRRVVRLWAPGTAPPSADQSAHVVDQPNVVRGQGYSPFTFVSPADLLFWGTVGVGTGVPIAIGETGS